MMKFENVKENKIGFESEEKEMGILKPLFVMTLEEVVDNLKSEYIINKKIPEELINMDALNILETYVKDTFGLGIEVNDKGNLQVAVVAQTLCYNENMNDGLTQNSFVQIFCNGGIINKVMNTMIHKQIKDLGFDIYKDYEDLLFVYKSETNTINLYSNYEIKLSNIYNEIQSAEKKLVSAKKEFMDLCLNGKRPRNYNK